MSNCEVRKNFAHRVLLFFLKCSRFTSSLIPGMAFFFFSVLAASMTFFWMKTKHRRIRFSGRNTPRVSTRFGVSGEVFIALTLFKNFTAGLCAPVSGFNCSFSHAYFPALFCANCYLWAERHVDSFVIYLRGGRFQIRVYVDLFL